MDMIEEIARAICKARLDNGGVDSDDGWSGTTPATKEQYRKEARAVAEVVHKYQQFA